MVKRLVLSYSTINNLYLSPHSFLNKALGIEIPTTEAMTAGKEAHLRIQDHVLGIKKDDRLSDLKWNFKQKEYKCFAPYNDKYQLYGFVDAVNFASKLFLEIKTSSSPWSQQKFDNLEQWRFYALALNFRKVLFITCTKDLQNLKTFYREVSEEDLTRVKKWIDGGIDIIEKGNFKSDLDENGKCQNPKCPYSTACYFL